MKFVPFAAAAFLLATAPAAFAQSYVDPATGLVGGASDTASTLVAAPIGVATGVLGGVGSVFTGRSAYEAPVSTGYGCSVVGGGAVGTCNSAVGTGFGRSY
jgi:hypothetical protein